MTQTCYPTSVDINGFWVSEPDIWAVFDFSIDNAAETVASWFARGFSSNRREVLAEGNFFALVSTSTLAGVEVLTSWVLSLPLNSSRTVRCDSGSFFVREKNCTLSFFCLFSIHKVLFFFDNGGLSINIPTFVKLHVHVIRIHVKSEKCRTQKILFDLHILLCIILLNILRNAPPNTTAGPLSDANYNCMEISTSWRNHPPRWLDQGRGSELSCGRGTERVLDRYLLQLWDSFAII